MPRAERSDSEKVSELYSGLFLDTRLSAGLDSFTPGRDFYMECFIRSGEDGVSTIAAHFKVALLFEYRDDLPRRKGFLHGCHLPVTIIHPKG